MSVGACPVRRLVVQTAASSDGAKITNNLIWQLHDVNLKRKIHGRLAAPSGGPGKFAGPVVATDANGPMQDQAPMPTTPTTAAPVWVRWLRWRAPGIDGSNWAASTSKPRIPGLQGLGPSPADGAGFGQQTQVSRVAFAGEKQGRQVNHSA